MVKWALFDFIKVLIFFLFEGNEKFKEIEKSKFDYLESINSINISWVFFILIVGNCLFFEDQKCK